MAKPTEEDLGIEMTPEERETLSRPAIELPDDDTRPDDDDEPEQQGDKAADGRKTRQHGPDGKFLPADKAEAPPAPPQGYVSHQALHEERQNRRILEERLNILLDGYNRREQAAAQPNPEPAKPVIPGRDEDVLGHYDGRLDETGKRLEALETATRTQTEQAQTYERENQEIAALQSHVRPMMQEAIQADPSLAQTYSTLYQSMLREIAFNNNIDPNNAQHVAWAKRETDKLEAMHISAALQRGDNPVDYMRRLAAMRGIQTPTGQQQGDPGQASIAERQSRQQRHQSLGDLPGNAAPSKINAKDLVKMSTKEFAEFAKKMGDAGLDELFAKA